MDRRLIFSLFGQIALTAGTTMLLPLVYALLYMTAEVPAFLASALIALSFGELFIRLGRTHTDVIDRTNAAALSVLGWPWAMLLGALPFMLSGALSPVDALFESCTALTSTGISLLGTRPPFPLDLWRAMTGWLGSFGFALLVVTLLPMVTGPLGLAMTAAERLSFSPLLVRMRRAMRDILRIYAGLTAASALLFFVAGQDLLDSILLAMMTLSTSGGGHELAFLARRSPAMELAAIVTMLAACGNFMLYWRAFRGDAGRLVWWDTEFRTFLLFLGGMAAIVSGHLFAAGIYDAVDSVRYGVFEVVSFASTSGFHAVPVEHWPAFDLFLLLLLALIGGTVGSLSGGLKMKRVLVLAKMTGREMKRTIHPHMVEQARIGTQSIPMHGIRQVLLFFFLYMVTLYLFVMVLAVSELSLSESAAIAVAMLSRVGSAPGLYTVESFAALSAVYKLAGCLFMMIGRIGIFAVLLWIGGMRDLMRAAFRGK